VLELAIAMRDYYITKGGRMGRKENTIELNLVEGGKRDIPINDIRSIYLLGETDLNTRVLDFLGQRGVPVHIFNWYGHYVGSFYPRDKLLSGFLLVKQVQHYLDMDKRLAIAKELVNAAIYNIIQNLDHYNKEGKEVSEFIKRINEEKASLSSCATIQDVMGVEGRAREIYYSSFGSFLREGFEFERRTRRPPENMLNSLISFGNSFIYATTLSEIYHTQLTPTVSYLHEPGERRFSLALDLSEVFKPLIVDRIIFNLINNRMIKEGHFMKELNFCYLNDEGRKLFISEYDKRLNTTIFYSRLKRHVSYQGLIRMEAFKLVKHLLGEAAYTGFHSQW